VVLVADDGGWMMMMMMMMMETEAACLADVFSLLACRDEPLLSTIWLSYGGETIRIVSSANA